MLDGSTPKWLKFLERRIPWLAIPGIGLLFITLQALGFLLVMSDPVWELRLALDPLAVLRGLQLWRLVTFLALPLSMSWLWVIFVLWFLYFVFSTIESEWGSFKTTLYVLVSVVVTITFSLTFDYPVTSVRHFESTMFLAAASLFPETEILVFGIVPVKMKWLAWLSLAFVALELVNGGWLDRFFIVAIYSNCLLFFGPAFLSRLHQWKRRRDFRKGMGR